MESFSYQFILDGLTNRVALVRLQPSDNQYDVFAGSDGTVSHTDDTNWHYLGAVVNGASSSLSIDGANTAGLSSGANSLGSTYCLGCVAATPGVFGMGGYIAELIIYNTALNTTDRQRVEAYLAAKYAI